MKALPFGFQTILQKYNHQNRRVLAQKQTHGSMEQKREPRNKLSQFMTKEPRIPNRNKSIINKCCWENWTAVCKRMLLNSYQI